MRNLRYIPKFDREVGAQFCSSYYRIPQRPHRGARANRVCDGKSNGLIVDYIGIVKALRKALADYTQSAGGEGGSGPVIDKQELIARINALIGDIVVFLSEKGFSLDSLIKADGFERLAKVKEGAD